MRRLAIVTARYPYGTQETYIRTELEELRRYFERIVVVPVRPPRGKAVHAVPDGVSVLHWPLFDATLVAGAMRAIRRHPARVRRVIAEFVTSGDPGALKNIAVFTKALALANYVEDGEFEHVHAYWMSTPASVAALAGIVSGVPWSATAHRWDIYERNAFDIKQRSAAFVRTISQRGARDIAERMPKLASRIHHLGLGAVVPAEPITSEARDDGAFEIVCPAALVPVKGHVELLDAIARMRDNGVPVRCTLVGSGPLRRSLKERAAALRIADFVTFTGFVAQETLHRWYRDGRFAAVVLASRNDGSHQMEGIPSALIEAMAFGVPIVATDSGSIGELADESCAHVVPAGDAAAVAAALTHVYRDPQDASRRAHRAYERVKRSHDVRFQMRAFAELLTSQRALA